MKYGNKNLQPVTAGAGRRSRALTNSPSKDQLVNFLNLTVCSLLKRSNIKIHRNFRGFAPKFFLSLLLFRPNLLNVIDFKLIFYLRSANKTSATLMTKFLFQNLL
uniref:Uncharacterized protein n=1 Tax=Romanomermis culicivorax TaxID=13658 RepID=A0A915K421_ROMCU